MSKALRKQGAEVLSEKKYPLASERLPSVPCRRSGLPFGESAHVFDEQMM